MTDDDAKKLAEISRDLPTLDVDEATAGRIATTTRAFVGRGNSPLRFIEPILVALLVTSILAWTILKLVEVLG